MAVNNGLRNAAWKEAPQEAGQPFSGNGDHDGAVPASVSAPAAPAAASPDAEAAAAGNAAATAVEVPVASPVCAECGAGRHATRVGWCVNAHDFCWVSTCGKGAHRTLPNRCAGGHVQLGNRDAWKTGEHSTRPADTDGIDAHLAAFSPTYRASIESDLWTQTIGLIRSMNRSVQDRPRLARNPRIVQQVVGLHQQARTIDAGLRESSPPTVSSAFGNATRLFVLHADEFEQCMREVIELQPTLADALRAVLAEHDAKPQPEQQPEQQPEPDAMVPVARVDGVPLPRYDEPDEIIL